MDKRAQVRIGVNLNEQEIEVIDKMLTWMTEGAQGKDVREGRQEILAAEYFKEVAKKVFRWRGLLSEKRADRSKQSASLREKANPVGRK